MHQLNHRVCVHVCMRMYVCVCMCVCVCVFSYSLLIRLGPLGNNEL